MHPYGESHQLLPMLYTRTYEHITNAIVSSLATGLPINAWMDIFLQGLLEKFGLWPGHAFLLGGEPLTNYGSPGHMDTDQGRTILRRGNHRNPSPQDIPPRGRPLATAATCNCTSPLLGGDTKHFFPWGWDTDSPKGGIPWKCFGLLGRMDTNQGRALLKKGNHGADGHL